jgi:hypothetical protein
VVNSASKDALDPVRESFPKVGQPVQLPQDAIILPHIEVQLVDFVLAAIREDLQAEILASWSGANHSSPIPR